MRNLDISHPALTLFSELLVPSPSGREQALATVLEEKLHQIGISPETDGAGNLIVRVAGQTKDAPLVCFAAHMDEIGMVVTRVETDGTLKVSRSGGLYPWKIGERPVELLGDRETIQGILSMGSTHIREPGKETPGWEDVWIITGLPREKLREAGIRPGTSAVPLRAQRGPVVFGDPANPLVGAWTFDDRAGVVTLARLLERLKKEEIQAYFSMIVSFTVHEEGGGNGAKVLAQREKPDIFIAVDGAPIPPGSPLSLDGRPAIWSKDTRGHYDQRLILEFMEMAKMAGTELQPVVYQSAASDASLVYYAGGAPRICCIGHVRENSHGFEVIRLSVLDNLLKTLVQFVKTWKGD